MILITGATGLVGSHVLLQLLREGRKVRAIIRRRDRIGVIERVFHHYSDDSEQLLSGVEWVESDLLDYDSLLKAFSGIDQVIHTAAVVSFDKRDKDYMYRVNVQGTTNIVNASLQAGVSKIAYVSSVAALGSMEGTDPVNEDCQWNDPEGATHYALSKYFAEMEVWRGVEEGLNAVIVNPSTILGPGEWGRSSTALVYKVHNGLKVFTDGVTGYVDVRDVAEAVIRLLDSDIRNQRFLLSAGNLSYRELFTEMATALGKPAPTFKAGPWMVQTARVLDAIRSLVSGSRPVITRETATKAFRKVYYDGSKIKAAIGFKYTPLPESIRHVATCLLRDSVPG